MASRLENAVATQWFNARELADKLQAFGDALNRGVWDDAVWTRINMLKQQMDAWHASVCEYAYRTEVSDDGRILTSP
jgi:hypothetical protein